MHKQPWQTEILRDGENEQGSGVLSAQDEHDTPESAAAVEGILFGDEDEDKSAGQHDQEQNDENQDAEALKAAEEAAKKKADEEGEDDDDNLTDEEKAAKEEAAKKAAEEEGEEEEDYIEVEIEGQEEPERYSVNQLFESHQQLEAAQAEVRELRQQATQIPAEVDAALKETIETRQQLVTSLQQWENLVAPPEPNKDLLNPENPDEKGGYDPQMYAQQMKQRDNFVEAQAAAKAELKKQQEALNTENAIRFKAVKDRATAEVQKIWPEMFNEDTKTDVRKNFTEGMVKHYGATEEEVKQLIDPRLFALAKDALAYRASQKANEKAITKVRGKPKLIRSKAPSNSARKTTFNNAMDDLSKTGSDEAAVAALGALDD